MALFINYANLLLFLYKRVWLQLVDGKKEIRTPKGCARSVSNQDCLSLACFSLDLNFSPRFELLRVLPAQLATETASP